MSSNVVTPLQMLHICKNRASEKIVVRLVGEGGRATALPEKGWKHMRGYFVLNGFQIILIFYR